MPTTVASRAAMPEPSTVVVTTHRPRALDSRRPGLPACGTAVSLIGPSPGNPLIMPVACTRTVRDH